VLSDELDAIRSAVLRIKAELQVEERKPERTLPAERNGAAIDPACLSFCS
jgi:hypothetical protein